MTQNTNQEKCLYENFPLWIVVVRHLIMTSFILTGALVMYRFHIWAMIGYLVFYIFTVAILLSLVCRNCYYHGKRCDLAMGLLAGLLLKKGPGSESFRRNAPKTYPFLIILLLVPLAVGVFRALVNYSTNGLIWLLLYLLSFAAAVITTRYLSCPNCRMQGICSFCMVPKFQRVDSPP